MCILDSYRSQKVSLMNVGYHSPGEFNMKLLELYEDIQGLEIHERAYAPLGVGTVKGLA